jgi:Tol biopolymer transport system component
MRNRRIGLIPKSLVLLVLAFLVFGGNATSQEDQDRKTLIHQKLERLHALATERYLAGGDYQSAMELMQGFKPLMQQQKFSEAEALLNRALKLLGDTSATDETTASGELSLIAYGSRDDDGRRQIFVIKPDGTGKKRLTEKGNWNSFPAWSPDGKKIAFTSDRRSTPPETGSPALGPVRGVQVWVMDASGGNPIQLTNQGENANPAWSPDGTRLAFASNRTGHLEIWVMEANGSNQKQLTTTGAGIGDTYPAWSPDGRRIALTSTRSGNLAIWVMDSDGGNMTQLTSRFGDTYPDSELPAWSPDGARIAFWSGRADKGFGNIWVIDADGTNPRRLTNRSPGVMNCDEPAWSPDGEQIAFSTIRNRQTQIWAIDPDGKNQRSLIADIDGEPARVSWQPLGSGR